MAAPTRSVEEILARVISREIMMNPRLRGMWAVLVGGAVAMTGLLFLDFFQVPLPFTLDFLAAAGPPLRVLAVIALVVEGALVAERLGKHDEPPYPGLAQAAAISVAAIGVLAMGIGAVVFLFWNGVLLRYFPDWSILVTLYYGLLLAGAAMLLSALPAVGACLIRPLVVEHA
jgi:hypothetical protein